MTKLMKISVAPSRPAGCSIRRHNGGRPDPSVHLFTGWREGGRVNVHRLADPTRRRRSDAAMASFFFVFSFPSQFHCAGSRVFLGFFAPPALGTRGSRKIKDKRAIRHHRKCSPSFEYPERGDRFRFGFFSLIVCIFALGS